jgi:hypothetical protein
MNDTDRRKAFIEAIMRRLQRQYAERVLLPAKADEEGKTLSLQMLQRLYRYVMSEGYGE